MAALLTGRDALLGARAWLAVLACDMPFLTAATFRRLRDAAGGRDGAVLAARTAAGSWRWCSTRPGWTPSARAEEQHGLALHRLLAPLDLAEVPAEGHEHRDVDTWADLRDLHVDDRRPISGDVACETRVGGKSGAVNLHDWIDELCDVLDVEDGGRRGPARRPDQGRRPQRRAARRAGDRVPPRLRGRSQAPTPRRSRRSPPGPRRSRRAGTGRPTPRPRRHRRRRPRRQRRSTTPASCTTTTGPTSSSTKRSDDRATALRRLVRQSQARAMRAVARRRSRWPRGPVLGELPDPEPGPGEVLLDVAAARPSTAPTCCSGRASTRRRRVRPTCSAWSAAAPSPRSGTASRAGRSATRRARCSPAGGYATQVAVPAGQLMPVPDGVDLVTAAALPEVACTVWSNVFMIAGAAARTRRCSCTAAPAASARFAIQLAAQLGARVFTTAGTPEKRDLLPSARRRGRDRLPRRGLRRGGQGAHRRRRRRRHPRQHGRVVPRAQRRRAGRRRAGWSSSACRAAPRASSTSARCCASAARSSPTTLRARPAEEKAAICASVVEHVWPLVADGPVRADRATPRCRSTRSPRARADGVRRAHREDPARRALRPAGYRGPMSDEQATGSGQPEDTVGRPRRRATGPGRRPGRAAGRRRPGVRAGGGAGRGRRAGRARSPTWSSSPPR